LQASGVKIPVIDFREGVARNRLDAFKEIRKQLAPNYVLRVAGDGKIWAQHLRQRVNADYELKLMRSLTYASNPDIFTRVKMFGENAVPKNVLIDAGYSSDGTYSAYAENVPLVWVGDKQGDWYYFTVPNSMLSSNGIGVVLDQPQKPTLWIDGLRHATWAIDNVPYETWGYVKLGDAHIGLYFTLKIDRNSPIIFYVNGEAYTFQWKKSGSTVTINNTTEKLFPGLMNLQRDDELGVYKWIPADDSNLVSKSDFSSSIIEKITSITSGVNYSDAWEYTPTFENPVRFKVNKDFFTINEEEGYDDRSIKAPITEYGLVGPGTGFYMGRPDKICDNVQFPSFYGYSTIRCNDGMWDRGAPDRNYVWFNIPLDGESIVHDVRITLNDVYWKGNPYFYAWNKFTNSWDRMAQTASGYESDIEDHVRVAKWVFGAPNYYYTDKIQIRCVSEAVQVGTRPFASTESYAAFYPYEVEVNCYKGGYNMSASFWYQKAYSVPTSQTVQRLHDGVWDTQCQSLYTHKPIVGHHYLEFAMPQYYEDGSLQYAEIDAIDITGGWFIPNADDPNRRYEINNKYSIEYYDGSNWYPVSQNAENFSLGSGDTQSFEKEELGDDFRPEKLAIVVQDIEKFEGLGPDRYIIPIVEFAAYKNTKLVSDAKLIASTLLTVQASAGESTVNVQDTSSFTSTGVAYIETDAIAYTGKTATTLTGVTGIGSTHSVGVRVSQTLEDNVSPNIYDPDHLLTKFGDKLHKDTQISTYLNTQTKLNDMTRLQLKELTKNITTVKIPVLVRPDAEVGDTVTVTDPVNVGSSETYFVEAIRADNKQLSFTISKYWSLDQEDS
jgi:hypothetical protein